MTEDYPQVYKLSRHHYTILRENFINHKNVIFLEKLQKHMLLLAGVGCIFYTGNSIHVQG